MKRLWWVVRIAVIVAASYCIFAPDGMYLRYARAEEEGGKCNTNTSCSRNSDNNATARTLPSAGRAVTAASYRTETPDADLAVLDPPLGIKSILGWTVRRRRGL